MIRQVLVCLVMAGVWQCVVSHHLRHHSSAELKDAGASPTSHEQGAPKSRRSLQAGHRYERESARSGHGHRKLDKMMNKAILQIILGDLRPADMLLLKALNYTAEDVMTIREHELSRLKEDEELHARDRRLREQEVLSSKYQAAAMLRRGNNGPRQRKRPASSVEAYNRQAVYDYESGATVAGVLKPPHVVFKIGHDDSEVDEGRRVRPVHRTVTAGPSQEEAGANLEEFNRQAAADYENLVPNNSRSEETSRGPQQRNATEEVVSGSTEPTGGKRASEYEGLEWVGGDIYRVKPEAMEALFNYEDEPEERGSYSGGRLDKELANDTFEYQNDADESGGNNANFTADDSRNLTSYQRLALAQRRDANSTSTVDRQGQKAIEDIKLRVLAMTGRFNLSSSSNQVQQRLTMFTPTCQVPRNTDAEAWSDPYSMNMHFQLNLTSGEHVLAAKLRLFKLPQDRATSPTSSTTGTGTYEPEEMEEDEKKIRISVYFYTKSLKKHRAKKRLMDSIVTPLTSQGGHLALDVRQGLRFWRPPGGNQQQQQTHGHASGGNHGLVVQVEDQDGRPLKPALYIQEPSCQSVTESGTPTLAGDEKISLSLPFSSEPVLVTFVS
ncbi:uncharacterized protein LOC106639356 isoform X2 [Copidosoma floridanum]|uniref:uncharacterized protein LOC106639356 isoform X2 n=1 Tax=Copidosoma floridanum TaxID=29053 RepID=UPI0006C979B5|nr:uncharacterized protein LOC106639356 isoform X2 [Copidosoma floridanum]